MICRDIAEEAPSLCIKMLLAVLMLTVLPLLASEQSSYASIRYREDFANDALIDPVLTTAYWHPEERSLMQGFQEMSWQSTNRAWTSVEVSENAFTSPLLAVGDINNNGYPDLVVGGYGQENRLYLNLGNGVFTEAGIIGRHSNRTRSISLGDLNGDGHLDIIEGNENHVNYLYFNLGNGFFCDGIALNEETDNTRSTAVGDINGNGSLDIVVGNYGATNLLYLNQGDGTFAKGEDITEAAMNTLSVALGDINNDGHLDLVAGNWGQPNRVYLNDGVGGFLIGYDISHDANETNAVALGDINGNGRLDVIIGNYGKANRVCFNLGHQQWQVIDLADDIHLTTHLAAGDLDGDGTLDVVSVDDSLTYHAYFNRGNGSFQRGRVVFPEAQSPAYAALGDFNSDGRLDIAVGENDLPVRVFLNQGCTNPFRHTVRTILGDGGDNTTSLAIYDMDGNGHPDLIAGSMNRPTLIYSNHGRGNYSSGMPIAEDAHATTSIAVGDLNGNGLPDIVTGNMRQVNMLYWNNGDGTWSGSPLNDDEHATTSVALGDINSSGHLDIVIGNMGHENQLMLNLGDGTFKEPVDITDDIHDSFAVALKDMNGDGYLDVVVGNYGTPNRLYLNTGNAHPFGGISGQDISEDVGNTLSVALGDVNGNGLPDVVAGNYDGVNRVYFNNGKASPFADTTGENITDDRHKTFSVALVDVDGDGDLDVVTGNAGEPDYTYLNNGTAAPFASVTGVPVSRRNSHTLCVIAGDMDADDAPEIIAGFRDQSDRIYHNPGRPRRHYGILDGAKEVASILDPDDDSVLPAPTIPVGEHLRDSVARPRAPHFDFSRNKAISTDLTSSEEQIVAITVGLKTETPPNTGVDFYVSNSGGEHWISARNGQTIFFPASDTRLRWKAVFHSLTSVHSAQIQQITLEAPTFSVTYATDGTPGATLEGEPTQRILVGQSAQPVTAIAPTGHCFSKWVLEDIDYGYEETVLVEDVRRDFVFRAVYSKEIRDIHELQLIGAHPEYPLDGNYCLLQDIDAEEKEFSPIASLQNPFSGCLFGNNHVIRGLRISTATAPYEGLFRVLSERAEIHDLHLADVNIGHNGTFTGAIAGQNNGLISNCHVTGKLYYEYYTDFRGGLVAENGAAGVIRNSSALMEVRGIGSSIGGLVGRNLGVITDSYTSGAVNGGQRVGGLVGHLEGGSLVRCWSTSDVQAASGDAGGLIGTAANSTLEQCFASGSVTAQSGTAGGLLGSAWQTHLHHCFSSAKVAVNEGQAGGLVGLFNAGTAKACFATGPVSGQVAAGLFNYLDEWPPTLQDCYWDIESTGQKKGTAKEEDSSSSIEGKSTAEMLQARTFANWGMPEDSLFTLIEHKTYPYFAWQPPQASIEPVIDTTGNDALFDIYFSMPVPHFDIHDLHLAYTATQYAGHSLTPYETQYPTRWRVAIQVTDPVGRVSATVNIQDLIISDTATTTVFAGAPTPPVAQDITEEQITWAWEDNSDKKEGFMLYVGQATGGPEETATRIAPDVNTYTMHGLSPNTSYICSVTATYGKFESTRKGGVTAWTLAKPPIPPTVSNPTLDTFVVAVNTNDDNPPATEYAFRLSPAPSGNIWIQPDGLLARQPAWHTAKEWAEVTVTRLKGATEYSVVAVARNNEGVETIASPESSLQTHCSLLYTAGSNGSVSRTPNMIAFGGDGPHVTATPEPGYRFVRWSDGVRDNPRQDKNITSNIAAMAIFDELFSGDGTQENPYTILDVVQLQEMQHFLDSHFVLKNDIDASSTTSWNEGAGFQPIGTPKDPFIGSLSGSGHVVTDLFISRPKEKHVGLIGVLGEGGQIEQVTLKNARVNGYESVGALAGMLTGGVVRQCRTTGIVEGNNNVGGLVGHSNLSTLMYCAADVDVTGAENVGGLAGFNMESKFLECYALGTVQGRRNTGGLAGYNYKCDVLHCYSRSSVQGAWYAAGLLGYNHMGSVRECYAAGPVTGSAFFGGLVAFNDTGTIEASYWDREGTGQATSHEMEDAFGKTMEEMQRTKTYTGWDFESVWVAESETAYPRLRKLPESPAN